MATFAYRGTDRSGRRKRGAVTATSPRQARDQLRDAGLRIESLQSVAGTGRRSSLFGAVASKFSRGKTNLAIRELATLIQVGVPLLEGLDTLAEQSGGAFRTALMSVRDRVAAGDSLAKALAEHPRFFDEMVVGMVRVGEHAGTLEVVLHQLADFRERSAEFRDRVQAALLYPMIVLFLSGAISLFLMTVVVPMLLTNLVELGRPLPWPTQVLKWCSDTLLTHGWWIAFLAALLLAAIGYVAATPRGRRLLVTMTLHVPVIGSLVQRQAISRMAIVVSSLLKSGVELVEAFGIAQRTSSNILIRDALADVSRELESGRDLAVTLAGHRIFPPTVAHVFALGQRSGELDSMLQRLGDDYDRQAASLSGKLASLLEPALIVVLAVVVGFILFATILPIMEAGNVLES